MHFVACAFGIGALPWMPGTWATLAAIPICLALRHLPIWGYVTIVTAMVVAGIYLCGKTNRDFGSDDHPACAWDEMASFPIVMIAVPITWYTLAIGVILFRLFDIWKPWPISWVDQNLHGGVGVMLDDILAALFSLAILHGLIYSYNRLLI